MINSTLKFGSHIYLDIVERRSVYRGKPDNFQIEKLNDKALTLKTVILLPHKFSRVGVDLVDITGC